MMFVPTATLKVSSGRSKEQNNNEQKAVTTVVNYWVTFTKRNVSYRPR